MYYSFLDSCGGHTSDYHYHLNLDCLYPHEAGSTSQRAVESLSARLHRHALNNIYGNSCDLSTRRWTWARNDSTGPRLGRAALAPEGSLERFRSGLG